ncbi:MAG: hypothetical protein F6J93_11990 [Oscillatoria sp. SIO1A7]|nr:hypothetical protein [Oscillatoria sp. SIO1A7]
MGVNLFDANFYRSVNSDLTQLTDEQAFQHLQVFGLREGRRFSPYADLDLYRNSNPDLGAAGLTTNRQLFDHLQEFGAIEGRLFSSVFDVNFYRSSNPDLQAAGLDNKQLLEHFQIFGINEGRVASGRFDISFYLNNNPDLSQAGFNNQQTLEHYVLFGIREGRLAAPGIPGIPGEPSQPGSDINTAFDVGVLGNSRSFSDSISQTNPSDLYRFSLNAPATVNLILEGAGNFNLIQDINGNNIVDESGTEVTFSGLFLPIPDEIIRSATPIANSTNQEPGEISGILPVGTYFVQVENGFEEIQGLRNYNLTLAATPSGLPTDNAGNTLARALDLGVIQDNQANIAFSDFVGLGDRNDIYRFTLDEPATVNLAIAGLSTGVEFMLLEDRSGDGAIDVTDIAGQRDDIITSISEESAFSGAIAEDLPVGTYYVRVASEQDTNYNLSLSTTPFTPPPDNAGNSIPTARDLGVLTNSQTLSDALGFIDPTDFYRFTLENTSRITLSLSGLSSQPDFLSTFTSVDIIQDTNGNGEVDFDPSLSEVINGVSGFEDSVVQSLLPGTYYLRLSHGGTLTSFNYNLTVEAIPFIPPPDNAGNTPSEAREVDILTGSQTFDDFVGGVDRQDLYRFTLENSSVVSLVLDGVSDFTNLILIQDLNGNSRAELNETITADGASSSSPGIIQQTLEAGIYFVEVEASGGDTDYSLTLSV